VFFFQAEDGIRDGHVTGVQTCALPIFGPGEPGAVEEPLNRTITMPRVFFDTYAGDVLYSGLAPGVAGRYQVTVRVPLLVSPATNISVSLLIEGFASNRVTIPVR